MFNRGMVILLIGGLTLAILIGGFYFAQSQLAAKKANDVKNTQAVVTPKQDETKKPATGIGTLPKTAFPVALFGIFSASAMISGWFLRKFPE